jgi:uncharacterized protein
MKSKFPFLITVCLLLALRLPSVLAAEVAGLYQATTPVDSRDDERQRLRAFAAAMRAVLVKVSGHEDIRSLPAIQRALSAPQSYVESWAYRTQADVSSGQQQLMIEVIFFQAEIRRLLDSAGIAVWPQTRPETLVWLVVRDEQGQRLPVGDSAASTGVGVMQALDAVAALRGLPVLAPRWDFADDMALPTEMLWALDEPSLRLASARYQYDSILAIRVLKTAKVGLTVLHCMCSATASSKPKWWTVISAIFYTRPLAWRRCNWPITMLCVCPPQ